MKKHILLISLMSFLLFSSSGLKAQEGSIQGAVYYVQMDKVEFEPTGRPQFDQFASTMPTEYEFEKVLYFDEDHALFTDSPNPSKEPMSRRERWFYHMSKYGKKPKATLNKMYLDFEKGEKTELLEFMTREFRVSSPIEQSAWKMTGELKSILDYTCMGAQMMDGEDEIIAYFTPQIPVASGPDKYNGLPGIILAVEKNGYTTYLASKIEMKEVDEFLEEPKNGKKVTQEELDEIIQEKIEEFKEERMGQSGRPHRH
jgi:GLPGLI family protein